MGLLDRFASFFRPSTLALPSVSPRAQEQIRAVYGGIQPRSTSLTRAYLDDLETAQRACDTGDLSLAARLSQAARSDAWVAGVLSTRTDGCTGLPRKFVGNLQVIEALESNTEYARAEFDELAPQSELSQLVADSILLGVGVGELVQIPGRPFAVLTRLDPSFLRYRHNGNVWTYQSLAGPIEITPGDGRWVLHAPGGRYQPWNAGLWRAVCQAWITKTHSRLTANNWEASLANSAKIAVAPSGASEAQADSIFEAAQAWGIDTTFLLRPGYDIKLLESNGRGYEAFSQTIKQCNDDLAIALAGQLVTTGGGAGFMNMGLFESIRSDLIQSTADSLAYTINTQILPSYVLSRFGESYLEDNLPIVTYDSAKPGDKTREASVLVTAAQGITQLTEALKVHGRSLNVEALCAQYSIPLRGPVGDEKPLLSLVEGGTE